MGIIDEREIFKRGADLINVLAALQEQSREDGSVHETKLDGRRSQLEQDSVGALRDTRQPLRRTRREQLRTRKNQTPYHDRRVKERGRTCKNRSCGAQA